MSITIDERSELRRLADKVVAAAIAHERARREHDEARIAYYDFVASLRGDDEPLQPETTP